MGHKLLLGRIVMDNLFEKFIAGVSSKVPFAVEARKRYTRNDVASYFIGLPSLYCWLSMDIIFK